MNETKRFFRFFWAWDDEREEAWLTEMARQGWHLVRPALGFYPFAQGEPQNIVYRLDFKPADKDRGEYLQLFADAGWEHVGVLGNWQYFRKECVEGEQPEIYTDNASKIQKYQRVFLLLIVFFPVYSMMMQTMGNQTSTFMNIVGVFFALLMLLYVYAIIRLFMRILQLKKRL